MNCSVLGKTATCFLMPVEPQVGNVRKAFLRSGAGASELHHCAWIRSVRKGTEMIAKENISNVHYFCRKFQQNWSTRFKVGKTLCSHLDPCWKKKLYLKQKK